MGPEDIEDVAAYLGVDAGEATKRVARLLCAGGKDEAHREADYSGFGTCKAAAAVAGGGKGCTWGCLGLADCERVCLLDAIYMNEDELPVVIPERCTACNDCVETCPKDLFVLMPMDHKLIVQCRNLLHGDDAEDLCSVACNACTKCVADAAPGLIEMVDNLAVVNYELAAEADPKAVSRCPTGAIAWVDGQQFPDKAKELEKRAV
jgi:Na+-translocating ferredoxin:NAD+ oxidoreductase RNF subunit RnfB